MLKGNHTLEGYLEAHLSRLRPGDYFALLAYIEMNEAHEQVLQAMRHGVRDARHVATCLNSDQGSCTQRDKPIRADRTRACSCRSRATTPSIWPCRTRNTRSASSRRLRHEGISRFWWSASAVRSAPISARTSPLIWVAGCIRFGAAVACDKQPDRASLRRVEVAQQEEPVAHSSVRPRPAARHGLQPTCRLRTSACCRTVVIPSC